MDFLLRAATRAVLVLMLDQGFDDAATSPARAQAARGRPPNPAHLNLVPITRSSGVGIRRRTRFGPVPATMTYALLRVFDAAHTDWCQLCSTSTFELMRPIQVNLRAYIGCPGWWRAPAHGNGLRDHPHHGRRGRRRCRDSWPRASLRARHICTMTLGLRGRWTPIERHEPAVESYGPPGLEARDDGNGFAL